MPYITRLSSIHPIKGSDPEFPFAACEPDYKIRIANATLRRRMSRIVKMGVACGLDCLNTTLPESVDAIITATGLGCLADTEKFMNTLLDNEEQMLNPTPFIQSTFNTIGAQIALLKQIHAYNMTYVHRETSFESALQDAMLCIEEGSKNVLVGAFDELTPVSYILRRRMGMYRNAHAGEGAQFFLLSAQPEADAIGSTELVDVETCFISETPSPESIILRINDLLQRNGLAREEITLFVNGKNGNKKQDAIYEALHQSLFASAQAVSFKEECGEYPTASAFAVWKTTQSLHSGVALIYNQGQSTSHSFILIRRNLCS